jgi:hypothetical protein
VTTFGRRAPPLDASVLADDARSDLEARSWQQVSASGSRRGAANRRNEGGDMEDGHADETYERRAPDASTRERTASWCLSRLLAMGLPAASGKWALHWSRFEAGFLSNDRPFGRLNPVHDWI